MSAPARPRETDAAAGGALRAAFADAVREAREKAAPHFVVLRRALPPGDLLNVYAALEARAADGSGADAQRCYWEHPRAGLCVVASGAAGCIEEDGAGRIERSAGRVRALFARCRMVGDEEAAAAGPLLLGGFAFDDDHTDAGPWSGMPGGRLVLPSWQRVQRGGSSLLCVAVAVTGEDDPDGRLAELLRLEAEALALDDAPWRRVSEVARGALAWDEADGAEYRVVGDRPHAIFRGQVELALRALAERGAEKDEAGECLEKVVLARSLRVHHPGRFELIPFLNVLRRQYPGCSTFSIADGQRSFIAASPERLVALDGTHVRSGALAGTAPRGRSPEEDERLGRALCESPKDLDEHAAVVRCIREDLALACARLEGPEAPELMKIEGLQHLYTPLEGRLDPSAKDVSVLDLVARLHPTPAVGGLPRARALSWIREHEGMPRGWYAGPVGFVDAEGGGEFWVALRSGLVRNGPAEGATDDVAMATLFAGVGLVPGSEPESELQETRLKLRALLAPLTEI